jgi:hypothetical protein
VRDRPWSGWPCTTVISTKCRAVIHLDLLKPGQTINSDCYITTLTKLKAQISRVKPEKKTTFLLQHDNTRPHTRANAMEHVANLVPSDYHLFKPMKDGLCRQYFPDSNAVITSGSPPLVQIFMSSVCSLLFITGENA